MREILFRGQRTDNRRWVYGYPEYNQTTELAFVRIPRGIWTDVEMVSPITIGQYTGLTDMAGKKIFEGDIIRYPISPIRFPNRKSLVYAVLWDKAGGFTIFTDDNGFDPKSIEVIGNIHDNPELLKGDDAT